MSSGIRSQICRISGLSRLTLNAQAQNSGCHGLKKRSKTSVAEKSTTTSEPAVEFQLRHRIDERFVLQINDSVLVSQLRIAEHLLEFLRVIFFLVEAIPRALVILFVQTDVVISGDEDFQSVLFQRFQPAKKRFQFFAFARTGEIAGVEKNVSIGQGKFVRRMRIGDTDETRHRLKERRSKGEQRSTERSHYLDEKRKCLFRVGFTFTLVQKKAGKQVVMRH